MSEKRKHLKIYPDENSDWCIIGFNPICLWDGNISEMEVGDKMIVEVVEMTDEEVKALPEFMGW